MKDIIFNTILINKNNNIDTPFYIIDKQTIYDRYNLWINHLSFIKPYYAVKCNNNIVILKILNKLGCNFDCASKKELIECLTLTNNPSNIIYANPCKQISYIKYAKDKNISLMTFDCIEELEKIYNIYPDAKLILRIAVDDSYSLCKFNSKFGCSFSNIPNILLKIKELDANLEGISFHVGSNCSNSNVYSDAIKTCKTVFNMCLDKSIRINIIDIGGGFACYNEDYSKFIDISNKLNYSINLYFKDINIKFIAEPGRFFVEQSHILVLCVISKKVEENVIKYYLNDGIYGSFNCINYDHNEPVFKEFEEKKREQKNSIFFGPTCDSMDIIYKNIEYPELEIGEYLYIENMGAYTVASSSKFNGFKVNDIIYI